jgi:DNA-binding response OmpR family regulator
VTRKLLLADDSVTIQRVVELTFSGEDIDVVTVSDGEQAIARMSADPPDIVLADIAMPKKNGYEVAAFVKEHATLSQVPVLLLAGAFEPVDEERARRVKCDGVLVKPFETHEVIARVRELLDGKHLQPVQAAPVVAAPPAVSPPIRDVVETAKTTPPDESVDDYFDRLDVAFATRTQTPPRPFPHLTPPTPEPPDTSAMLASSGPAGETEPRNVIADLFKLFLEVEQGERDASSIQIPEEIDRIRRSNTIE